MAVLPGACSKSEPEGDAVVIATDTPAARSTVWVDMSLKDGKAEWHPFKTPEDKPPVDPRSATKDRASKGGDDGAVDAATAKKIEADVRAMVAAYNDLARAGKSDELVDYWVESQQELTKKIMAAVAAGKEGVRQLRDELNKQAPDSTDRVAKALAPLEEAVGLELTFSRITVKSDKEAEGFVERNPGKPAMFFHRDGEDWYLRLPDELIPIYEGTAGKLAPAFAAMKQALQNGAPAESLLQQLEALGAMMGSPAGGEAKPDAGDRTDEGS